MSFAAVHKQPVWKHIARVSSVLLGFLFLVSAFAKAWDADTFAVTLREYGLHWFGVWAPMIIAVEAVLGLCLLMQIRLKWTALAADIFLVIVSAGFAYGVLAKGIEDCGCFGALDRYHSAKPWVSFVRNAVFMLLTVPIFLAEKKEEKGLTRKLIVMVPVLAIIGFVSGLAMKKSFSLPRFGTEEGMNETEMMAKLQAEYPFSSDSTYVVYLFSFTCPHCQNYYANVEQYQRFGLADKVLGLAVEDEEAQARFERIYQPQIEIITIPKNRMSAITPILPIAVYIGNDTIRDIEEGVVFSPGVFMD